MLTEKEVDFHYDSQKKSLFSKALDNIINWTQTTTITMPFEYFMIFFRSDGNPLIKMRNLNYFAVWIFRWGGKNDWNVCFSCVIQYSIQLPQVGIIQLQQKKNFFFCWNSVKRGSVLASLFLLLTLISEGKNLCRFYSRYYFNGAWLMIIMISVMRFVNPMHDTQRNENWTNFHSTLATLFGCLYIVFVVAFFLLLLLMSIAFGYFKNVYHNNTTKEHQAKKIQRRSK